MWHWEKGFSSTTVSMFISIIVHPLQCLSRAVVSLAVFGGFIHFSPLHVYTYCTMKKKHDNPNSRQKTCCLFHVLTSLNEAGQQDVKRNRRQRNNPLDIYLINTLVSVNQFDKNLSSSALVTVEERGKLWAHKCTFHRYPGWTLILWLDVTKVTKSDSIRIFCRTIVEGKKSRPRSFFDVDYV